MLCTVRSGRRQECFVLCTDTVVASIVGLVYMDQASLFNLLLCENVQDTNLVMSIHQGAKTVNFAMRP